MKQFLMMLTLCLFGLNVQAQNVRGKVVNEAGEPVEFANIVLLALPDSTFISGVTTDEQGVFSMVTDNQNKRIIRISSVGYVTRFLSVKSELGTLTLNQDTQLLGEVEVKGEMPKMQMKGDAMVTHVQGSILEKAGTAEKLLDRIPQVSSSNGDVSVFGRGSAEIYVNGRKLQDYKELQQIAADNIASVEVVSNPGARYAASTRAVIRIKTKKAVGDGFGYTSKTDLSYQYDYSATEQLDVNYRQGGLDVSGRLQGAYSQYENHQDSHQESYFNQPGRQTLGVYGQESNAISTGSRKSIQTMLQTNYIFKNQNALGARYEFTRSPEILGDALFPTMVSLNGEPLESSKSQILENGSDFRHSVNVYFNGNVKGWGITWNGDGLWSKENSRSQSLETLIPVVGDPEKREVNTHSEDKNNLLATKLVLEHQLGKGKFSFGGEYSGNIRRSNYLGTAGIINDDMSKVHEQITSLFTEYAFALGKVTTNAGLRYEHVNSDYYVYGEKKEDQCRTYSDVFPSLSLSTVLAKKVWVQLSYGVDITRPNYSYLSNSVVYLNRYTYSSGNPTLKPYYSKNLTLNLSYKTFYAGLGYQHIKDAISVLLTPYADDPTINCQRPQNLSAYDHFYAVLNYRPTLAKIWHPTFSVNFGYQNFEGKNFDGMKKFHQPLMNLVWYNHVELPNAWLLDVNMVYVSKGDNLNTRIQKSMFQNVIMIQRDFLKNRLNLMFTATNPIEAMDVKAKVYSGNNIVDTYNYTKRSFLLTATYRFNTTKDKYRGTGAGTSMKSRL